MLRDYLNLIIRTPRDRNIFVALLLVMVLAAALEAAGVGLIMPFVAVVQDPDLARANPWFRSGLDFLGTRSDFGVVVLAGVLLTLVFLVKNAYVAGASSLQMRFIFARLTRTCDQLMEIYLSQPLPFFVQRASPDLVRTAVTDATNVFQAGVPSLFVTIVEALTTLVLIGFLVYLEPIGIPAAGLLVTAFAVLFFRQYRKRFAHLGEVARDHQGRMLTWAHQAFGGIKETKVLGVEGFFLRAFHDGVEQQSEAFRKQRLLMVLPRNAMELMGVITLVGVIVAVVGRGVPTTRLLPLLGALALAVVRLMPSAVRMFSTINEMRFHAASARAVARDLERGRKHALTRPSSALPFRECVRTLDLGYTYEGAEHPALSGVSVVIQKGEAVGLLGASGAGKTTFVDLLIGLLQPTKGHIEIDDTRLEGEAVGRWQRLIGYIPQTVYLTDDTIRRNVAFGIDDADISEARVKEALQTAQLLEFALTLPEGLDTVVGERGARLSGGQKQRIGIARALYFQPQVLVLDEATSALDGITELEVVEAIESLRKEHTTIVIAHRLSTVRNCNRILFMEQGRVAQVGTWAELMESNESFRTLARLAGAA